MLIQNQWLVPKSLFYSLLSPNQDSAEGTRVATRSSDMSPRCANCREGPIGAASSANLGEGAGASSQRDAPTG
jgi:hypothetical protein